MAVTEALIRDMVLVAASACSPDAIILFGSHAAGTADENSDVDLLIVRARPFDSGDDRREEMVRLWRALSRFPVAKDILLYSRDEVERWRNSRNHVIARALKEGRVLYGSV
jgi:predicted nucleotidyltransferase